MDALELRLQAAARAPGEEAWRGLAALDYDILELLPRLAREEGGLSESAEAFGLSTAAAWRGALEEEQLEREREAADELLGQLFEDEAERWKERAARPAEGVEACFELLAEASLLDRRALARRPGRPRPLAGQRGSLREEFARRLASQPPTLAQCTAWAADLEDRANDALTSVDAVDPHHAATHLEVVRRDLAWHLEQVERDPGPRRKRLSAKWRRLRNERQERLLQARFEDRFGRRWVAHWERLILVLILLVIGILIVEVSVDLEPSTHRVLMWIDAGACAIFLWDFGLRWAYVGFDRTWFWRHWLIDLLPSIPYGLLLGQAALDPARMGRAARFLRLPRVARYLRLLLPLIRVVRALGFLSRGIDRLVRRYGHLLNRSVILHPTRRERLRAGVQRRGSWARLWRLRTELTLTWKRVLHEAPPAERPAIACARLEALERARTDGLTRRPAHSEGVHRESHPLCAGDLLELLQEATPEALEAELGPEFTTQIARATRIMARAPMRWLPFVRSYLPRPRKGLGDAETAARAARQFGTRLGQSYDRMLWFADLYGTVTPSELVDRVGSALVKRTARPAYRLLLFGGIYLVVYFLLAVAGIGVLRSTADFLGKSVGPTLVVLGSVCLFILALGWWMKRMADKATSFYDQVASAQFLHLTDTIKIRHQERDADLLEQRVFALEARTAGESPDAGVAERREQFLGGLREIHLYGHSAIRRRVSFDAVKRASLLYRDAMDGALLAESDTRTTSQLLGSLALRHLRAASRHQGPDDARALALLDLERRRNTFRGPYLWFSFISQAVAQAAARLVVDYNRNAIPLTELDQASPAARNRYEAWLASEESEALDPAGDVALHAEEADHISTAFNVLHFLDDDPGRETEIEGRFGEPVLAAVRRDRRRLFRRIFGTYPLHLLPADRRILNLRQSYGRWLEGGRALFLPVTLGRRAFGQLALGVRFVVRAIGEIRHPKRLSAREEEQQDDFASARRKVDRMRGPGAQACLWQRALIDVEYLGVALPGEPEPSHPRAEFEVDMAFLELPPEWRLKLRREKRRAEADMRRLQQLIEGGLLERVCSRLPGELAPDRDLVRAVAVAYRADYHGLRGLLSAREVLDETWRETASGGEFPGRLLSRPGLVFAWRRYRRTRGEVDPAERDACWRAVQRGENGAAEALLSWSRLGPEAARRRGEDLLLELLRHPGRMAEELVTLRVVQTLSLIDILNYRTHVWRLGQYTGTPPGLLG